MNATLLNIARVFIATGLVLMVLSITGCSTLPNSNAWYATTLEPMQSYTWTVKRPQEIEKFCGPTRQGINSFVQACAVRVWSTRVCHIFSIVPENLAANVPDASGRWASLKQHELSHCGLVPDEHSRFVIWDHQ